MNKSFLFLLLSLSTLISFAEVQSGSCGDNLTYTLDTDTGILKIEGSGAMNNYSLKPAPWHDNRKVIRQVNLSNGMTSIGNEAFYYCSSLTSVTIPNSVISIGSSAFSDCSSLTKVMIPNSVTSIGDEAFIRCANLTSVTIPKSVISIGEHVFSVCSNLTSITVDSENPNYASYDGILFNKERTTLIKCPESKSGDYQIPVSVAIIGEGAFSFCSSLLSVSIPYNVISIGAEAFKLCSGLSSVTIPNSVTNIGASAFYHCSGLSSVTIPNSVTNIGASAFSSCSGLTSVTIPNSVTNIGANIFINCSSLCSISVEAGNPKYASLDGVLFNNDKTNLIKYPEGKYGGYQIPNSVVYIGENAFFYCSHVTSVGIPNSVICIGSHAFQNCTSLTELIIPNSVTSIGEGALQNCSGLTSVSIPNSVTSIGEGAFRNCSVLTSVTIPNSVISIEDNVFRFCLNLTKVTIPEEVTNIGKYAFYKTCLTSVTIPKNVRNIGQYAFYGCSKLDTVRVEWDFFPEKCSVSANSFDYTNTYITKTLLVPQGCMEIYKAAKIWKDFQTIAEFKPREMSIDPIIAPGAQGRIRYTIDGHIFKNDQGIFIQDGKIRMQR